MAEIKLSILNDIKKVLGFEPDYKAFDQDIIMHINSTFFVLHQLGVGPKQAFSISDESATWTDFTTRKDVEAVKSLVYIKVRLLFDPPTNSFGITAMQDLAKEYEWRLNVQTNDPEE